MNAEAVEWLDSDEGEQWSRARHDRGSAGSAGACLVSPSPQWRATGPLNAWMDPAGAPPVTRIPATEGSQ